MKIFSLLVLGLFLTACAGSQGSSSRNSNSAMPDPNENDVQRVQAQFPDATLAKLEFGLASYKKDCMKCHGEKDPRTMSTGDIKYIVPVMATKTNDVAKQTLVTADKEAAILQYMLAIHGRGVN